MGLSGDLSEVLAQHPWNVTVEEGSRRIANSRAQWWVRAADAPPKHSCVVAVHLDHRTSHR
eukprot:1186302-Amphidinium_carterae.1